MNKLILTPSGNIVGVGDAGKVADLVAETGGVEISREDMKTHAWRLPVARTNRLQVIRNMRDAKLLVLDREANHSATGRPGQRPTPIIENARKKLRDLPPVAAAALAAMINTDDMNAYVPVELRG